MKIAENKIEITFNKEISYSIYEQNDIFNIENNFFKLNRKNPIRRFIILDSEVDGIYGDKIRSYFEHYNSIIRYLIIKSGENNKTIDTFIRIFEELDSFDVDRKNEPIISIGGGVVTDVGGFVASCYRRGVPHIAIPTTLMGYVDASIGIKTGVDFNGHKNRMGSFDAPQAVYLDKLFLKTLPKRHIINGVGEILKIALIKDEYLFQALELDGEEAIRSNFQSAGSSLILNRSIVDMLEELEPNLYEDNLQRCVDYGHTFSTLLEMHDVDNLLHGEAVAIDSIYSICLSFNRGFLSSDDLNRVLQLMKRLQLPTIHSELNAHLLWESVCERTLHRGGLQRIPLPTAIGKCTFVNDVTEEELRKACSTLKYYNHE